VVNLLFFIMATQPTTSQKVFSKLVELARPFAAIETPQVIAASIIDLVLEKNLCASRFEAEKIAALVLAEIV